MTERSNFDSGPPDEGTGDLLATIRHWGSELGFQALGFTGVDLGQHRDHLAKWLDAGYHGEMTWMAGHGDKRSRPESLVPGTCTVISARMDICRRVRHPSKCWPTLKRLTSRGMRWAVTTTK